MIGCNYKKAFFYKFFKECRVNEKLLQYNYILKEFFKFLFPFNDWGS